MEVNMTEEEEEVEQEVVEIENAHTEISTSHGDTHFKDSSLNFPGVEDYEAEVVVEHDEFWSTHDDHPLENLEVVQVDVRHSSQRSFTTSDDEGTTVPEFASGVANLTPDQAREVAENLEEYADKVEEMNKEQAQEEAKEVLNE
jgi:hypothetical protein